MRLFRGEHRAEVFQTERERARTATRDVSPRSLPIDDLFNKKKKKNQGKRVTTSALEFRRITLFVPLRETIPRSCR